MKTFFIANWRPEGGIWKLDFDPETEKIISVCKAADGQNTAYFETQEDILYVLSEIGGPGRLAGRIESFRMSESGLVKLDEVTGIPSGAPHLKLGNHGKTMYVASYATGAVCSVDVDAGRFGQITSLLDYEGHSIVPERQESPHAHMFCETPDGGYMVCVDLGTDELRVYAIEEDGCLKEHHVVKTPAGYGPRHMVFSKDGRYAYVVCELQYHLLSYRYLGEGQMELVSDLKVIEDLPEDQNWGGAIKISSDGDRLYISNRGTKLSSIDTISLKDPASPERKGTFPDCAHPRDYLFFEAAGKEYLLCLNMTTEITALYAFDPLTNTYRFLDQTNEIPMPVCAAVL